MPYKRKRSVSTTRRTRRRALIKRRYKGKLAISRNRFNIHTYKRWGAAVNYQVEGDGTSTYFPSGISFFLGDVVNNAELIALYDQYKIMCVVIKIQLLNMPEADKGAVSLGNNTYSTAVNATQLYPKFWYYRDYDDSSAPSTLDQFKEVGRAKCLTMRPNKTYSFKIKPAILRTVGLLAESAWPKRLDCSISSVPHYGFKFALDTMSMVTPVDAFWKIRIEKQYYLKFFNSR